MYSSCGRVSPSTPHLSELCLPIVTGPFTVELQTWNKINWDLRALEYSIYNYSPTNYALQQLEFVQTFALLPFFTMSCIYIFITHWLLDQQNQLSGKENCFRRMPKRTWYNDLGLSYKRLTSKFFLSTLKKSVSFSVIGTSRWKFSHFLTLIINWTLFLA